VANGLAKTASNNKVRVYWSSLLGKAGEDATLTLNYFAPNVDVSSATIVTNPAGCANVGTFSTYVQTTLSGTTYSTSNANSNTVTCYATTTISSSLSPDGGYPFPNQRPVFQLKLIHIVLSYPGLTVRDRLAYSASVSLSDYYNLGNTAILVYMDDGLVLDTDAPMTFTYGSTYSLSSSDYWKSYDSGSGITTIRFDVRNKASTIIGPATFQVDPDPIWLSDDTPHSLPLCQLSFKGATLETRPATAATIFPGNTVNAMLTLLADVSGTSTAFTSTATVTDKFAAGALSFSIYAIDGTVCSPTCPSTAGIGHDVSFRLIYDIPTYSRHFSRLFCLSDSQSH